jgi:hypothetical protein
MRSENCKKEVPSLEIRIRAILCCIWFGTMPWRLYETNKHYCTSYFLHLKLNWSSAYTWLTNYKVDKEELEFEQEVNPSWSTVFNNMFSGLR